MSACVLVSVFLSVFRFCSLHWSTWPDKIANLLQVGLAQCIIPWSLTNLNAINGSKREASRTHCGTQMGEGDLPEQTSPSTVVSCPNSLSSFIE